VDRPEARVNLKLNLPKLSTFWAAVIIAAVGIALALLHFLKLLQSSWVAPLAFLLVVIAFVLLCLGLTLKDF
jgi:CHASE2 domain-containing sensor protein